MRCPPVFRILFLFGWWLGLCVATAEAEPVAFARHLALSPDGNTLAFSWAGDIWTASIAGGAARRLTVNAAHDSHPVWSRDGSHLAFSSNRHGAANVFLMTPEGTDICRLTFGDQDELPTDFSIDDQFVLYRSRKTGDLEWLPRMWRVPVAGGQSWPLMAALGSDGVLNPDGQFLAFTRGASKWWRTGYRGSANWDVWLRDQKSGTFRQLTNFDGTDFAPQWAGSERVFFLSDRVDTHNVWSQSLNDAFARQITHVKGDRVRDFVVSRDGRVLVYTQWDKTYVQSLPGGKPRAIEITATSDVLRNDVELKAYTNNASESLAAPDGSEIALVVRGELFVISAKEGKPARQITDHSARDQDVAWSPDGKAVFFVSDRDGWEAIYRATSAEDPPVGLSESLRFRIERVTDSLESEFSPQVSPDGKWLSFVRNRGDLIVRDLKSGAETCMLENWNRPTVRWSPDSKWIAYAVVDAEYNPDVWIVSVDPPSAAAVPVNISQHPDFDGNPQWSADGQVLAFTSRRAGTDSDLYLVFLSRELDEQSAVDLDEYFEQANKEVKKRKPLKKAVASGTIHLGRPPAGGVATSSQPAATTEPAADAGPEEADAETEEEDEANARGYLRRWLKELLEEPKPGEAKGEREEDANDDEAELDEGGYEYELHTAYRRIRRVTSLPANQFSFALAPAGDLIAFTSGHEGSNRLFTVKWNGDDRQRILSSDVGALRWTLDGKRLFYQRNGVPGSCTASGKDAKTHSFRCKLKVRHRAEAAQKFDDAARMLGRRFYHPTLKGLDWEALTAKYRALALRTHTYYEFNEIFNRLQGELNGSHLAISGPGGRSRERVGYLGCEFDPAYSGPGLKITAVTPHCPADRKESKLLPGDVLLSVGGRAVGPDASIEQALIDTVGDQVVIEFIPSPDRQDDSNAPEAAGTSETPEDEHGEESAAIGERPASEKPEAGELVIRPISYGAFAARRYDDWVARNRAYVERESDGKLAYTHISGMGESQFHVFERDLYAVAHGKDGLIIDVRNNGGGWTADWVMAVLSVRRHAYTVGRGGKPGYPQDRLIFYAWTKPATMMCNQFSYSNAEIVSHAFKNLRRGELVGTDTFGAVISTGSYTLIDGARVRMPFRGWYALPADEDMENHGAVPTLPVAHGPADEQAGRFPQLDAAIRATLVRIESALKDEER